MFGFFEKKKGEIIDHWYALIPGFNTSAKEFYAAIEEDLKEWQVPGLGIAYVDFTEGGILSAKRQYLRMSRERLVFDICSAPFGTGYFFSCRFAEIPAVVHLWELIVLLVALVIGCLISFAIFVKVFGLLAPFIWPVACIGFIALSIYTMRHSVAMGLKDLDAALLKIPVINSIYEVWIRKETYYRQDTRLMYRDTVNAVVKAKVEEITGAKGVKLVQFNEYSPILGELYKARIVTPPPPVV